MSTARDERHYITMLMLPWFDERDELEYSTMSLTSPGRPVCARKARRLMRRWYKQAIGKVVPKEVLERVWSRKFVTRTRTEAENKAYLDDLVTRHSEDTDDTIEDDTDISVQSEASKGTE